MRLLQIVLAALVCCGVAATPAYSQQGSTGLINPVFSDHAVLQRDQPVHVWGQAAARARVTASLAGQTRHVRADAGGRWSAEFPPLGAGGPYDLTVRSGGDAQTVSDVLIGDVYLCSGQSNMEFQTRNVTNAQAVLEAAGDAQLRMLHIQRRVALTPQETLQADDIWKTDKRENASDFSAVCYLFGRELRRWQNVPIGLIDASWEGTVIEAWTSRHALSALGGFETPIADQERLSGSPQTAQREYARAMAQWWSENDPGSSDWGKPGSDDSGWRPAAPLSADNPGLTAFDGLSWYRAGFTLSAAQAASGGQLDLDQLGSVLNLVFLNGEPVGATSGLGQSRNYQINDALIAGRNVIAVALGEVGPPDLGWMASALTLNDGSRVPLVDRWSYRTSRSIADISARGITDVPQRVDGPNGLSTLFNGMIAPLGPYGVAGALWYQGEANVADPRSYARLLPAMIADWRRQLRTPDLPFLVVQLTSYGPAPHRVAGRAHWAPLREAQRSAAAADTRIGLAVTIDVGDVYDIRPTQKRIVAERLARLARAMIYHEDIVAQGPAPVQAIRSRDAITVSFANAPLRVYSANRPIAFELCDGALVCHFADAEIIGDTVQLDASAAPGAEFVRYCWADAPICNLFNDAGLPATPFLLEITYQGGTLSSERIAGDPEDVPACCGR